MYNWRLTLVVISIAPLLAAGGMVMANAMMDATSEGLGAYATAGGIAEECFGMIRCIKSFSIERRVSQRYKTALLEAEAAGIKKQRTLGFGMGFTFCIYFLSYVAQFPLLPFLAQPPRDPHCPSLGKSLGSS